MKTAILCLISLVSLGGVVGAEPVLAGTYTFVDNAGVTHFTNIPADTRYIQMQSVHYVPPTHPVSRFVSPGDRAAAQKRFDPIIKDAARHSHLDAALVHAVVAVESGYDPSAVSSKGAVGLMQLMPQTGRRYGVTNLHDPAQNVRAGSMYLRDLLKKFNNDLHLSLAAYNAGEEAVIRFGNRIPPYSETQQYLPKVLELYRQSRLAVR
ncbi:MAG: lytic transglycosylase domain-containing protein [Pseudomonadota bacterium]